MHIIDCPQCRTAIEIGNDAPNDSVTCPSCGCRVTVDRDLTPFLPNGALPFLPIGALPRPRVSRDAPPNEIGNYKLDLPTPLGEGGQGTVYRYRHKRLPRDAAIKLPCRSNGRVMCDADKEQFLDEACRATELEHPNFVRVYDAGTTSDGTPFIAMELVVGTPVNVALATSSPRDVASTILKVARAIDEAHNRRILHRDIKPQNILVDNNREPKVVDLGLAIHFENTLDGKELAPSISGTPGFMAPEVATGKSYSRAADIYSLGATLYYLLTHGRCPIPFDEQLGWHDYVRRLQSEDPQLPRRIDRAIPKPLQNICLKALERDPLQRYLSAGELADDLERYLKGQVVLAHPSVYQTQLESRVRDIIREVEKCGEDGILSPRDVDLLVTSHRQIVESESDDSSIPDWVRIWGWQVFLYVGAMVLVTSPITLICFPEIWKSFPGEQSGRSAFALICFVVAFLGGASLWRRDQVRKALPFLISVALLTCPVTYVVLRPLWGPDETTLIESRVAFSIEGALPDRSSSHATDVGDRLPNLFEDSPQSTNDKTVDRTSSVEPSVPTYAEPVVPFPAISTGRTTTTLVRRGETLNRQWTLDRVDQWFPKQLYFVGDRLSFVAPDGVSANAEFRVRSVSSDQQAAALDVLTPSFLDDLNEDVVKSIPTLGAEVRRSAFLRDWWQTMSRRRTYVSSSDASESRDNLYDATLDSLLLLSTLVAIAVTATLLRCCRAAVFVWLLSGWVVTSCFLAFLFLNWRNFDEHNRVAVFFAPAIFLMVCGTYWERSKLDQSKERSRSARGMYVVGFVVFGLAWMYYASTGSPVNVRFGQLRFWGLPDC